MKYKKKYCLVQSSPDKRHYVINQNLLVKLGKKYKSFSLKKELVNHGKYIDYNSDVLSSSFSIS